MIQSLRFALRTLTKSPVFTTVAVLSLALGIGANTAIFTLMDQILLRMLPIRNPEQLVQLNDFGPNIGTRRGEKVMSYPMYREVREGNRVFDGVIGRLPASVSLGHKGQTDRVNAEIVTGNFFDVLGVRPKIGRLITPEDDRMPGAHPVIVLSFGYWERKFGGDPNVLGTTVLLNGHPMTVIGVTQAGYKGLEIGGSTDVLVPMMMKAQATPTWNSLEERRDLWLNVFARLKPGMSVEHAKVGLEPLYKQILQAELPTLPPDRPNLKDVFLKEKSLTVEPASRGLSTLRESAEKPLYVLMAMVGLVLLIACANVANLLTARAAGRQREIAIRISLGASRWQIIRQLLIESTVLSLIGGILGLLVAVWTGDLLLSFLPFEEAPRAFSTSPDTRVLAFNFAISIAAAFLFGLMPAIQAARHAVADTLKAEAGSVSAAAGQVRLRKSLVAAQIALSLLLLVGAGLFARSLFNLRSLSPGFATEHLMTFTIDPTLNGYERERAAQFFERTFAGVRSIPGVTAVSANDTGLMTQNRAMYSLVVEGQETKDRQQLNSDVAHVGPAFFATVGVPIVAGRDFTPSDRSGAPRVIAINETMAKEYFPRQNPLGKHIGFGRDKSMREIVAVVKDQKTQTLRDQPRKMAYAPLLQDPNPSGVFLYVRTALEPASIGTAIRRQMQTIDSNVPVTDMKTMRVQVNESLFVERLIASLSAFFGLLATLLAAIGLYGVMAYSVARRTREIGIRVALGAERSGVIALVMKEVALLAVIGIAVGLPLAMLLSKYVGSQLYGLQPNDPTTLAVCTTAMAAVALFAGYIPAERAARVDPILALRYE